MLCAGSVMFEAVHDIWRATTIALADLELDGSGEDDDGDGGGITGSQPSYRPGVAAAPAVSVASSRSGSGSEDGTFGAWGASQAALLQRTTRKKVGRAC
jgi:hypothetical protein